MISAYIARHFDRTHDLIADLFVAYAERELAKQPRPARANFALQGALLAPFALMLGWLLMSALRG